jgi:hypothetical protein
MMRFLIILILMTATGAAVCGDNELTPHLGVRFGGEAEAGTIRSESLEVSPALALTYDHRLRKQGSFWTTWSLQRTEFDAEGLLADSDTIDLDVHYLQLGTSYRGASGSGRTQGFVLFGLGLTWVDPEPGEFDSELGGSLLVGGGFRKPVKPKIDFRFDARAYLTFTEMRLEGVCGGVGCSIEFSGGGKMQVELLAGLAFEL